MGYQTSSVSAFSKVACNINRSKESPHTHDRESIMTLKYLVHHLVLLSIAGDRKTVEMVNLELKGL